MYHSSGRFHPRGSLHLSCQVGLSSLQTRGSMTNYTRVAGLRRVVGSGGRRGPRRNSSSRSQGKLASQNNQSHRGFRPPVFTEARPTTRGNKKARAAKPDMSAMVGFCAHLPRIATKRADINKVDTSQHNHEAMPAHMYHGLAVKIQIAELVVAS